MDEKRKEEKREENKPKVKPESGKPHDTNSTLAQRLREAGLPNPHAGEGR